MEVTWKMAAFLSAILLAGGCASNTKPARAVADQQKQSTEPKAAEPPSVEPTFAQTVRKEPEKPPTEGQTSLLNQPASQPRSSDVQGVTVRQSAGNPGSTLRPGRLILGRITADGGDGSKVSASIKAGDVAKGEIYDMPGLSHAEGTFTQKAQEGVKTFVVMGATAIIRTEHETLGVIPLNVRGEFLVDEMLKMTADGDWDGKKDGAVHTILGRLTMFGYAFDSNETAPLKFKITKDGYVYLEGKGTVNDLKIGKQYRLPSRAAGEQDAEVLRQAASEGNLQKVKELLDRGVDVNTRSESGVTPLMLACAEGQIDVVKLLLARGADVNVKDNSGRTALRWADLVRLPAQPKKDSTGMISIVDEKGREKEEIKVLLRNRAGK